MPASPRSSCPSATKPTSTASSSCLDDHAVHYDDGKATDGPIPPEMEIEEHSIHDALIEGIVVGDDDLMERYLADETIPIDELAHALADGVASGSVFPVLCGSATKLVGVDRLAHFIAEEGPAPTAAAGDGQPVAFVFKTIVDPYVGHVNLFKVLAGHGEDRRHARERPHHARGAPAPARR